MENKYLEKIASIASLASKLPISKGMSAAASEVGGELIHGVSSAGKKLVRSVGHNFHVATGGGYRDVANAKGVFLQKTLRGVHNPESLNKVLKHPLGEAELGALQHSKNKAIIKSVGYAGGAVYGGNKILSKVQEQNQQQYY